MSWIAENRQNIILGTTVFGKAHCIMIGGKNQIKREKFFEFPNCRFWMIATERLRFWEEEPRILVKIGSHQRKQGWFTSMVLLCTSLTPSPSRSFAENGRCYTREWRLKDLDKFTETLLVYDKIAVEMTTNVRLFRDAVWPFVERADVVNTRQFKVVAESVKKTDKNDAVLLARFLEKDMLPTVHLKSRAVVELASLTRTRDTLVKQRTALKNQVNNLFTASGVKLRRERLISQKTLFFIGVTR